MTSTSRRPKVAIFQRWLMHYREPFFRNLLKLSGDEVDYQLLFGEPTGDDRLKKDWFRKSDLPNARRVEQWRLELGSRELIVHRGVGALFHADMVVSQQENRIAVNHALAARPRTRQRLLAWWGHGDNFQPLTNGLTEWISKRTRRALLRRANWFFAYTSISAEAAVRQGFPAQRITTINNTTDLAELLRDLESVTHTEVLEFRQRLGVAADAPMAVFIGGLYKAKKLPFLFAAGELIQRACPGVAIVIAGAGVDESLVRDACNRYDWLKYVGPVFGRRKAILLASASIWLNPGLVGLSIVDALAVGVPMITTTYPSHSPEIVYLINHENGVITEESVEEFADAAVRLITNPEMRSGLAQAGRRHSQDLTIERMASNFHAGVLSALRSNAKD